MFQDMTSIVVDIGTSKTRIGYGGDDAPLLMPHSYVSSLGQMMQDVDRNHYLVGDKYLNIAREDHEVHSIFAKKGIEGYQYDYDRFQSFLEYHLKKQLGVDLKNYSILLSEDVAAKPHQTREIRERTAKFLFERLNVANVFFLKAPVLSCFATGRSSALVIDSGQNFTRSVAVHEGFCLNKSAKVVPYAGKELSIELQRFLQAKTGKNISNKYLLSNSRFSHSFLQFHQLQLLSDIKQSLSIRKQEQSGESQITSIEYQLPDKQTISIQRKELKQGFIWGSEAANFKGAASLVTETVNNCDVDVKKQLYSNILFSGGNVLYGSLIEDLQAKISESAPANVKVKPVSVCWPNERKYLSWIGGSIVTSLSSFQSYWVGNQEWKETGAAILDKKCT